MNNAYRIFMGKQCLSEQAKQAFYRNLQCTEQKKPHRFLLKAAGIAACIVLMIPIAVFAVETIFNVSVVTFISGNRTSKFDTGFEIHYPDVSSRPLSDFSEEIRTMDGHKRTTYQSWEEAEEALGIPLVDNTILNGENVSKAYAYLEKKQGVSERVHCHGVYEGKDGQLYRATLLAAYGYKGMHITLSATVTCEHPGISPNKESELHWSGRLYESSDIAELSQEAYVASNGITATMITVIKTQNNDRDYRACFAVNGVSYDITVSYGHSHPEKAKDVLVEIVEAFIF